MGRSKCVIALDIGGMFFKSAIIDLADVDGFVSKNTFQKVSIDSNGSTEVIIGTIIHTLRGLFRDAEGRNLEVSGIGVAVPGPFDFKNGISLMQQKLCSIYGMNLRQEFVSQLQLRDDFLVHFERDAAAFLIGEAWFGAAGGYNRVIGITLGTGLGSAFMVEGHTVMEGRGVPPYSAVGWLPYGEGIVEDRISHCGIITRYKELSGEDFLESFGVKEIADKITKNNDINGLQVFEELGDFLGEVLEPIVSDFKAECLVIGGQIARCFSYFEKPLKKQLQSVTCLKKISRADSIDLSSLYGATKFFSDNVVLVPTR